MSPTAICLTWLTLTSSLIGCAARPAAATYVANVSPSTQVGESAIALAPGVVEGLPGSPAIYETLLAATIRSSGERSVSPPSSRTALQAAGYTATTTRLLAEELYQAARRGSSGSLKQHALLRDIAALAWRADRRRKPGYVFTVRVCGLSQRGPRLRYRVTAAIYNYQRATLNIATSFTRETHVTRLISELGNIGAQLLPQLLRSASLTSTRRMHL